MASPRHEFVIAQSTRQNGSRPEKKPSFFPDARSDAFLVFLVAATGLAAHSNRSARTRPGIAIGRRCSPTSTIATLIASQVSSPPNRRFAATPL
jgi:hypothetical protein